MNDQMQHKATPSSGVLLERSIYLLLGIIEALLLLRLLLSLMGANRGNAFADVVFTTTGWFVGPFLDLFSYQTAFGVSRLELETLVAMAVYGLVGAGLVALVRLPRRQQT